MSDRTFSGLGAALQPTDENGDPVRAGLVECEACEGTGIWFRKGMLLVCEDCDGTGLVEVDGGHRS